MIVKHGLKSSNIIKLFRTMLGLFTLLNNINHICPHLLHCGFYLLTVNQIYFRRRRNFKAHQWKNKRQRAESASKRVRIQHKATDSSKTRNGSWTLDIQPEFVRQLEPYIHTYLFLVLSALYTFPSKLRNIFSKQQMHGIISHTFLFFNSTTMRYRPFLLHCYFFLIISRFVKVLSRLGFQFLKIFIFYIYRMITLVSWMMMKGS